MVPDRAERIDPVPTRKLWRSRRGRPRRATRRAREPAVVSARTAAAPLAVLAILACGGMPARGSGAPASRRRRPGSGRARGLRMVDVTDASGITFVSRSGEQVRSSFPRPRAPGSRSSTTTGTASWISASCRGRRSSASASGKPGFGSALYRGLGGLRYADVTAAAGHPGASAGRARRSPGDFDGERPRRLLVTGLRGVRLLPERGGSFRETTAPRCPSRRADGGWCTSAAVIRRGWRRRPRRVRRALLRSTSRIRRATARAAASCRWKGHPVICGPRGLEPLPAILSCAIEGDGTFEDATREAGIDAAPPAYGLGVLPLDFNRDGRTDVYVANDMTPSHLWRNDGGRFTEVGVAQGVAYSADGAPEAGMGVDAADLNGDGIEDVAQDELRRRAERRLPLVCRRLRRGLDAPRHRGGRPASRRVGLRDPRLRRRRPARPLRRERARLPAGRPPERGLAPATSLRAGQHMIVRSCGAHSAGMRGVTSSSACACGCAPPASPPRSGSA